MPFTKTFHGFIENTTDTLLIIEACRNKILPKINRRLIERERHSIKSGTIIVFDETESGIKRWTDGFLWSPSRILGNFLVYRELASRETRKNEEGQNAYDHQEESALIHQRERALVGSLTTANTSYNFKKNGLIKKTIRILVNGNFLHIVSYYSKSDVLNNLLPTPSSSPELAGLQISADLMPHLQGYASSSISTTVDPIRKRSKSCLDKKVYDQQSYGDNNYDKIYYSQLNYSRSTPFTELPPPNPHIHSQFNPVTTAKAPAYANKSRKLYHHGGSSDPLSPSPTPSPPAIMCDNRYYNNRPTPFDPYRHHPPTLDNY
ncbi:Gti1/Pac2 family-domain-containing protein [Helicostylum pulchrum]|uniref:Gti1/Pac2 family-domain-containing protein n=1 Tax=Helicostylum pulchrum TaxID=562976 RepID=A0ABP9XM73_9FUNG|nr:Gti1/Pac2 family-domain-containing protein [Helicostylum pulchrum]